MVGRKKHIEGFTLAEVLIAVAIMLVLAALAVPSIISAQNNMRMVELNNAAESIANAAQTQMTAKKAAGTWLALIEKGGDGSDSSDCRYSKAVNRPTANASEGLQEVSTDIFNDTYYMTAAEAQAAGIIPALSIDDSVRKGNYLIEFTASTANVVSVFYTDGKSGFFGTAGPYDVADYYTTNSTARYQSARIKHSPMIGYYQGTPSGATNAVALANPVIWVDEENSLLCIENPNLSGTEKWAKGTSLSVTVKNLEEEKNSASFTISGLQGSEFASTGVVESSDSKISLSLTDPDSKVYQLDGRTVTSKTKTVFKIDLNALASVFEKAGGEAASFIANFVSNDQILVSAEVAVPNTPFIPATAKAYVRWPEPLAKLTVLVTNPSYGFLDEEGKKPKSESYITGTYNAPTVDLVSASGGSIQTSISAKDRTQIFNLYEKDSPAINNALGTENIEETRQVYSGKWVKLADAADQDANMQVSVGSYTPNGSAIETGTSLGTVESSTSTHAYQIYEIWVNKQRAGYLDNDVWHWDGAVGQVFANSGCVDQLAEGQPTANIESFTIDTRKLYDTNKDVIPLNDDEGYDVYVRTTPKTAEVKAYFEAKASSLAKYLSWNTGGVGTTGSRGMNKGAPVRKPFENEFGASSTVALWNTTTMSGTLDNLPEAGDLRIYYTATPAIAWGDMKFGVNDYSPYTTLPSAVLWFFSKNTNYSWSSLGTPNAYVRDFESTDDDNPKAFKLRKPKEGADYEIPYGSTTSGVISEGNDQLFYRAIEYYDDDDKRINWQYVPYTVQNDAAYASVPSGPSKEGYAFTGWLVDGGSNSEDPLIIPANAIVGAYDSQLPHGAVKLIAQYVKVGVGLIYAELSNSGTLVGWAGYLSNSQATFAPSLASDKTDIASFGYYVVVPQGKVPTVVSPNDYQERSLSKQLAGVDIAGDGVLFDLYRIGGYSASSLNGYGEMRQSNRTITYKCGEQSATYTFNLNFAAAVAKEGDTSISSADWGKQSSPWQVRHALQFPGSLPNNNGASSVQAAYQKNSFSQSHDIDMADTVASELTNKGLTNKYEWSFRGSYDGNEYLITNLYYRFLDGTAGITMKDASGVIAWGLFSCAIGDNIDNPAKISNIKISIDPGIWSMKASIGLSVGMLVGYASNCVIDNCQFDGMESSVSVASSFNSGPTSFGGLVGEAIDSTIQDSSVQKVKLYLSAHSGTKWNPSKSPAMGGLVGRLTNSKVVASEGDNPIISSYKVDLSISVPPSSGEYLCFGGIAGIVKNEKDFASVNNCYASEVTMNVPERNEESEKFAYFGTFFGSYIGAADAIVSNTVPTGITYCYGAELSQAVESKIGDAK